MRIQAPTFGFLSVFRNQPFFHLWISQITSQLSVNMTLFLLGLIIYRSTQSNTAVSGLFLAFGIPSVLFGMIAGAAVDYANRRMILIASHIIRALLIIGLVFVSNTVWLVYILLFLNAVVTQFCVPASASLIPKLVKQEDLVVANSLFSFAYYSSMAIGFIIAGPILRFLGQYESLAVMAVFYCIAAYTAYRLPLTDEGAKTFHRIIRYDIGVIITKVWKSVLEGISYVTQSHVLFDAVVLLTGTQIMIAILGSLGPGFADKVMGIDILDASVFIIGPMVVGILVGAVWVGSFGFRFHPQRLIQTGIITAGTLLVAISLTVYLKRFAGFDWLFTDAIIIPLEIFLFFLLGGANSLLDVPANSILQKVAEGDMRGHVYGVLSAAVGGVGILPVLLGGVLADIIGVGRVIFALGCLIALYGVFRVRYNHIEN